MEKRMKHYGYMYTTIDREESKKFTQVQQKACT